jgi:hypothetical protein
MSVKTFITLAQEVYLILSFDVQEGYEKLLLALVPKL